MSDPIISTWKTLREDLLAYLTKDKAWHDLTDCRNQMPSCTIYETQSGRRRQKPYGNYDAVALELDRMAEEQLILKVKRGDEYMSTSGLTTADAPLYAVHEVPDLCKFKYDERVAELQSLKDRYRTASELLIPLCGEPAETAFYWEGKAFIKLTLEQYEALADHVREKGDNQS